VNGHGYAYVEKDAEPCALIRFVSSAVDERKGLRSGEGIKTQVHVEIGPVKMVAVEQLHVHNLIHRGPTKPRKIHVGKKIFLIGDEDPEPMLVNMADFNLESVCSWTHTRIVHGRGRRFNSSEVKNWKLKSWELKWEGRKTGGRKTGDRSQKPEVRRSVTGGFGRGQDFGRKSWKLKAESWNRRGGRQEGVWTGTGTWTGGDYE
jgi:hypothetical protein